MEMTLRMVDQRANVPSIREQETVLEAEVIESSPIQPRAEKQKPFIESNTESVSLLHLKNDCIIPVFRDNEKTVSHYEFVDAVHHCVMKNFPRETVLTPEIRVSHKINGRIPSALNKKVSELEDWEKTLYWERMMFAIDVPSIADEINGNELSLTIGGVRALNHESLFSKKSIEKCSLALRIKSVPIFWYQRMV